MSRNGGGRLDRVHLVRERIETTPDVKEHIVALISLASAPVQERTLTVFPSFFNRMS